MQKRSQNGRDKSDHEDPRDSLLNPQRPLELIPEYINQLDGDPCNGQVGDCPLDYFAVIQAFEDEMQFSLPNRVTLKILLLMKQSRHGPNARILQIGSKLASYTWHLGERLSLGLSPRETNK